MDENKETTGEQAHCFFGPSTLPARAICPCYKGDGGSSVAESGTRAHKVVEETIKSNQPCVEPGMMGVTETPEMMGVDPAANYLPDTTDDEITRGKWGAAKICELRDQTEPGAHIRSEMRFVFSEAHSPFDTTLTNELCGIFGTVDAHWVSGDGETLYVADFKTYAKSDGEKDYQPQGKAYAVLIASNGMANCRRAVFFCVCAGDYSVARYDFPIQDAMIETVQTVKKSRAAVPGAGGLFVTGDEAREKCGKPSVWCEHCAYAATCPAISRAVEIVRNDGILTKPLAVRMAVVPILEAFAKKTKAEVREELDAGRRVFDETSGIEYALAERKGRAKLADLKGLAGAVIEHGIEPAAFAAIVSVSKTAVDGLLKAADEQAGRKVKKADREAVYLPYFAAPGMEKYVKRIS